MAVNTTVEVVMPAMGDSVSEGTVLEWHKQEGDEVAEDETLVEISTDKVDAEVPAPASGTVLKIHAAEGDTVGVGAVLAEIAPANGPTPPTTATITPNHRGMTRRRTAAIDSSDMQIQPIPWHQPSTYSSRCRPGTIQTVSSER